MGESTSQIEREILAERAALDRNLDALQRKTRDLADWRVHFRNHSGVFLGVAAGAGVVLGAMSARGRSLRERLPRQRTGDTGASPPMSAVQAPAAARTRTPLRDRSPKIREIAETWEHASEALLGVAISKVLGVVSDLIPGFRDQYDTHASRPSGPRLSGSGFNPGVTVAREPYRDR